MNSSVETRYPFLDEDVFGFLAGLHPRWKMRGLRDKYVLRLMAERWVPKSIAWRPKAMFRAPLDGFHGLEEGVGWVEQLLSPESLARTGYFDAQAVQQWRRGFREMRAGSPQRIMVEMGLVGVVATQLWHQQYIDSNLADLPSWSVERGAWSQGGRETVFARLHSTHNEQNGESPRTTHDAPRATTRR
jgi:asparagine synthase (glutamine-hydrolysing)